MPVHELFSKNIEYKYKSTVCSKATVFVIITSFFMIVFPFVVAYRSRGFWMKSDVFYEHPKVQYKYQYFFIAHTQDPKIPIVCSSYQELNFIPLDYNRCDYFEVQEINDNRENKNEELIFEMKINNLGSLTITNFVLMLPLQYILDDSCPLEMETLAIVQDNFYFPVKSYDIVGDLLLVQNGPINCRRNFIDSKYDHSIIWSKINDETEEFSVYNIIKEYTKRNVYTTIGNNYYTMQPGNSSTFSLLINLRLPETSVRYKPSFWQILKWAWIQYFSILVIIAYLVKKIQSYVFSNNIVFSFLVVPWEKSYY